GAMLVSGIGGDYDLECDKSYYHGTITTVLMEGNVVDGIANTLRQFASMAQWDGALTLNGEVLPTSMRKGHHRRDLDWCSIYTNQQFQNLLIVRINGQPMFTRTVDWKGCVLVELTGTSAERLVASRDRLIYTYASALDKFVTDLAVDKKSALRTQMAEYKRYQGDKLRTEKKKPYAIEDYNVAAFLKSYEPSESAKGNGSLCTVAKSRTAESVSIGHDFIVKNTVGIETPEYYLPGPKWSAYAKGLIKAWGL